MTTKNFQVNEYDPRVAHSEHFDTRLQCSDAATTAIVVRMLNQRQPLIDMLEKLLRNAEKGNIPLAIQHHARMFLEGIITDQH